MSKKIVFAIVLVGMVLALVGCGGNGVSCPTGYTLQGATQNNPDGFCKSADGQIAPVVKAQSFNLDLGDNNANPVQTVVCSMSDQSIVCQK